MPTLIASPLSTSSNATEEVLFLIQQKVASYYTEKIEKYGATPLGVDWSCQPTQELRFIQLLKLCVESAPVFSLNDVGCGYGALLAFMARRHRRWNVDYLGIDISESMIHAASKKWPPRPGRHFAVAHSSPRIADYSVLSGAFNVKLDITTPEWELFIQKALRGLQQTSRKGFAVNFLASCPGKDHLPPQLYYAQPCRWAEYCKAEFNATVTVLQDYGLREFTLLVKP